MINDIAEALELIQTIEGINLKYYKWYERIILSRTTKQEKNKTARHHVFPRSIAKKIGLTSSDKENKGVIVLTHKEHYVCHELLKRIFQNTEFNLPMTQCLILMSKTLEKKNATMYQKYVEEANKLHSIPEEILKQHQKDYNKNFYETHKDEIKDYRESHKDEIKDYHEAYRESHKDEIKDYRESHKDEIKAYYKTHKDEKKAYQEAYNEKHKDEIKDYLKTYRETHKDEKKFIKNLIMKIIKMK